MKIGHKSKDLLEFLFLTGIDALANTTNIHAFFKSYGGWENNSSYVRQMRRIREQGLIEWQDDSPPQSWVPKLTKESNSLLKTKIDPRPMWDAPWDGQWRTITFDLPSNEHTERKRLDTWLKKQRFGHLQGSLWLSPLPYQNWANELGKLNIDPKSVIFMQGRPLGQLDDEGIVTSCWPFERLSIQHEEYLNYLEQASPTNLDQLPNWFRQESILWRACLEIDPLLPQTLHPPHYKGPHCWKKRLDAYAQWQKILSSQ